MQVISIPEKEEMDLLSIGEGKHLVGEFIGDESGVSLIVFGSIHGNEQSGLRAMRRILPKLKELSEKLKGRVYLIAGNTRAINKNVRFIDEDLNRHWTNDGVKHNRAGAHISTNRAEDKEQGEILQILDRIFSTAQNEVYAMDLHSTSVESTPFAMIGDTLRNRHFAQKFPATFLLGIEEQLDGTIMEYVNNLGAVTLGFEAGQHTTMAAVDNQEAILWLALINSRILSESEIDVAKYREILRNAMGGDLRIIEIRYRHGISKADEFKMELGYKNFQPVKRGEVLAHDRNGNIKANESGLILMPLYQTQGDDGFFLGREISPFWLWLSRILRNLKIGDLVRFLPGVQQNPADEDSVIVNTNVARIFPLQIFHLLGFRKRRWRNERLVVSRRKHDTKSPFIKHKSKR